MPRHLSQAEARQYGRAVSLWLSTMDKRVETDFTYLRKHLRHVDAKFKQCVWPAVANSAHHFQNFLQKLLFVCLRCLEKKLPCTARHLNELHQFALNLTIKIEPFNQTLLLNKACQGFID